MSYLHRAWAEINLDALEQNFKEIRNLTKSKIFSVVKANAYGHSVKEVAERLCVVGTDAFAVSNIDEAKELREYGVMLPILILGYTPPSCTKELYECDITQTIYSLEYAEKLNSLAKELGVYIKAHLKVDTGMGRIGFDCRDDSLKGLEDIKKALTLSNIQYEGIFMHFAVADSTNLSDNSFTNEQYNRFLSLLTTLENDGFTFKIKHCCNSAATLIYPDKSLDAVRPGIILYGLSPSSDIKLSENFLPVMSFKTVVSMVKTINEGDTVSYGRTYKAEKPTKIATLTVGYADGYPRLLGNKGYVLIRGKKANIVGRICMDQMHVDVSDIEGVCEGDTVTLFGEGLPVEKIADWANTINYEIVCGLSKRVPRIYTNR